MISKDPGKKHFYYSMVKSGLRFLACGCLYFGSYSDAALLFFAAEVLGVAEEF